jgi:hypothetical protein
LADAFLWLPSEQDVAVLSHVNSLSSETNQVKCLVVLKKMNEKKTSEWLQVKGQEKILANGTCEVSGCLMFFSVTPHVFQ